MRSLRAFERFDLAAFLAGKTLAVTACRPWIDYETKATRGTKVEVVITRDDTTYPTAKDGRDVSNLYEKMIIKVGRDLTIPAGTTVEIVGGVATVYGDFRNQLSICADDVKPVTNPAAKGGRA